MTQILPSGAHSLNSIPEKQDIAVSIVVPIYNAAAYLQECLDSLIDQSLPSIEILCYDDASTDDSREIVAQYAQRDERVKLTAYPDNRSASQARKDGALAARGRYLMFVDSDDYLERDACEILVHRISELDIDILQFGTNVITSSLDAARIEGLRRLLAPLEEHLTGEEPFSRCFLEGSYGYTIWNKIYRTDVAKRAFSEIPDGYYPKAQDVLAYFVLAWHARTYQGITDCFYNYRFGAGITGAEEVSLERLAIFAKQSLVAEAIERFVSEHAGGPKQQEAAYRLRQRLVSDCVNQWFHRMDSEHSSQGFDILSQAWPMEDLAAAIHRQFHQKRQYLAPKIADANSLKQRNATLGSGTGTIGVFYHRLSIGGVQRVLSILVPMYLRMGYEVVMLLDEAHSGEGFDFPAEVRQIVLPSAGEDYRRRGERLREVIHEQNLDAILYAAGSSPILFYDLLVAKSEGLPFIVSIHDSAFHSLLHASAELAIRPQVAKLADVVQVLSEAEKAYWSSQGVNAVFIPNPITTQLVDEAELDVQPGMLLWIGRLDIWVKRCLDAVRAMEIVSRSQPDARLYMVGKEWTPESGEKIRQEINRLGLEEKVLLCDSTPQVEQYYRRADVVVITSVTESSSMAVVEAKAFGVPIAMYSLPHLATTADGKGFLSAPQGDVDGLAKTIVSILKDRELRQQLSQDGRESLTELSKVDLEAAWRELFGRAMTVDSSIPSQPLDSAVVGSLLSNALDIYTLGVARRREEANELRRQIKKLKASLDTKGRATNARKKTPSPASRRRRTRRRAVASAFLGVVSAVVVSLVICILMERWSAVALLVILLLGMSGAGAAAAYLHLLRKSAQSQRQLTRLLKSETELISGLVRDTTSLAQDTIGTNLLTLRDTVASNHSDMTTQLDAVAKRVSETSWAAVYSDTVNQSQWYRDRAISPGRWAVGYPLLYTLYRVLNETRPESILELGLGQSTKMIAQYAAYYQPDVLHRVVEHDPEWVRTMERSFLLPETTSLVQLELAQTTYGEDTEVISYSDFPAQTGDRKYNLICIDGPFGGRAKHYARVDVLSILPHSLSESFAIILDDHNRHGEQNTGREIRRVLRQSGVPHHWTEYAGEKSVLIITSADLKFLTSM